MEHAGRMIFDIPQPVIYNCQEGRKAMEATTQEVSRERGKAYYRDRAEEKDRTNLHLREKMKGMVDRGAYNRSVTTVSNLRKHNAKIHKTMILKTTYQKKCTMVRKMHRRIDESVSKKAYDRSQQIIAKMRRSFEMRVDIEAIVRSQPLRKEVLELRECKGRAKRDCNALRIEAQKARRSEKKAIDEAARLLSIVDDYELALAEIERLHWTKTHDLIPEHIQLAVREEYEPRDKITGSMNDVGLEADTAGSCH